MWRRKTHFRHGGLSAASIPQGVCVCICVCHTHTNAHTYSLLGVCVCVCVAEDTHMYEHRNPLSFPVCICCGAVSCCPHFPSLSCKDSTRRHTHSTHTLVRASTHTHSHIQRVSVSLCRALFSPVPSLDAHLYTPTYTHSPLLSPALVDTHSFLLLSKLIFVFCHRSGGRTAQEDN
jgi:hypothetical protein